MKDTYYFSHDANALTDTKILNLRADYGMEGYGLFWAIVEQLRNETNYSLSLEKNTYRAIKTLTATTIDVEKFICDCINDYGLFKEENGFFYSASLRRRMDIKNESRERRSEAGKKGAEKRWKTKEDKTEERSNSEITLPPEDNSNTMAMLSNEDSNAMAMPNSKMANDSKVKESKVKESKINNKLNKTKLNLLFNLIINNNGEALEQEMRCLQIQLKHFDILFTAETIKYLPANDVDKYKILYYVINEIYQSSYKVYLNKLTKEKMFNKYLKTEKYIGVIDIDNDNDEKLSEFVAYLIKSLQDEFENLHN